MHRCNYLEPKQMHVLRERRRRLTLSAYIADQQIIEDHVGMIGLGMPNTYAFVHGLSSFLYNPFCQSSMVMSKNGYVHQCVGKENPRLGVLMQRFCSIRCQVMSGFIYKKSWTAIKLSSYKVNDRVLYHNVEPHNRVT